MTHKLTSELFDGNTTHDSAWCLVTSRFIKRVEGAVLAGPADSIWDSILSKHAPAVQAYLKKKKCSRVENSFEASSPSSVAGELCDVDDSLVAAMKKLRVGDRDSESLLEGCSDVFAEFIEEICKSVNVVDPSPKAPILVPHSGVFEESITVQMNTPAEGVSIRFTTDGSAPGPDSPCYREPLLMHTGSTMVRACAFNDATQTPSSEASAVYVRNCYAEAITLQCFARCLAAKAFTKKLAEESPCPPPVFQPSGGTFFDGVHFKLSQKAGARMKYAIERPGKELEYFSYFRPVAVTEIGTFSIVAHSYRSNGVQSKMSRATFVVHNKVPPPLIFPYDSETIFKDFVEVSVAAAVEFPDDVVLEVAVGQSKKASGRADSSSSSLSAASPSSPFAPYDGPFTIRDQGDNHVTATALRRGPITGRWHSSPSAHAIFKIRRSVYRIPKEIVNGVIGVAGSSLEYLKKKEDQIATAISQALNFDSKSGSRCRVTEVKDTESGTGVDVHFALELDRDDDVNPSGQEMAKALSDRRFNEKLSTKMREVGLTARANRAKGLATEVKKADVEYLRKLSLDLAWSYGHMAVEPGSSTQSDYLDGSCLVFESERLKEIVDFRNTLGGDGGVRHSGDVMDPAKKRGRHIIDIDLDRMPPATTDLALCLSAYVCKDLSKFQNPSIELFSSSTRHSLTTFSLKSDDFRSSAAVMSMISKTGGGWRMTSCGFACDGTAHSRETYKPMVQAVAPLQERHANWRRRGPCLLALQLLEKQRCFPVVGKEKDAEALMLLGEYLPSELWNEVFQFL